MQTIDITNDYWTATAMAAATKAPVSIHHEDGSMYKGFVNECGEKHGQGTFKTAIYISGMVGDENSHMAKWTEMSGEWCNGLLHGQAVMREMSDKGVVRIVHDGMWDTGVPTMQDRAAVERLIMASLTTSQEFDFMARCDDQNRLPWCCE